MPDASRPPDTHGADPLRQVTDELVRCRRRGLARLDSSVGAEGPVKLPYLDRLSAGHCKSKGIDARDRCVAICHLLDAAVTRLTQDRATDGKTASTLFFGSDPPQIPREGPGELLNRATGQHRDLNSTQFRSYRREVFSRLARVLLEIVVSDAISDGAGEVEMRITTAPESTAQPSIQSEWREGSTFDDSETEILKQLRSVAHEYSVSEVLEIIVRFDTPDILG